MNNYQLFNNMPVSDGRLITRANKISEQISSVPTDSIPQTFNNNKDLVGAYRFLNNKKITPTVLSCPHIKETISKASEYERILAIQDTTHIDYSNREIEGMGKNATSENTRGCLLHTTLGATEDGVPIGILHQQLWTRPIEVTTKEKKLPIEEKESYKWLKPVEELHSKLPKETEVIYVGDRETDIYDLFCCLDEHDAGYVLRVVQDRNLADDDSIKLVEKVEKAPILTAYRLIIPASESSYRKREATVNIKVASVTIKRPANHVSTVELPETFTTNVVLAYEENENNSNHIYWLLLTSLPVSNEAEVMAIIGYYTHRWKIERFHYCLKSGCMIEELQLKTFDSIANAITLYSIVAYKILWLRYETQAHPEWSCTEVLTEKEWKSLYCYVNKTTTPPTEAPTLFEATLMIAKLGGFIGRKRDGFPGVKTIWRGLIRLNDISAMWQIFRE